MVSILHMKTTSGEHWEGDLPGTATSPDSPNRFGYTALTWRHATRRLSAGQGEANELDCIRLLPRYGPLYLYQRVIASKRLRSMLAIQASIDLLTCLDLALCRTRWGRWKGGKETAF